MNEINRLVQSNRVTDETDTLDHPLASGAELSGCWHRLTCFGILEALSPLHEAAYSGNIKFGIKPLYEVNVDPKKTGALNAKIQALSAPITGTK